MFVQGTAKSSQVTVVGTIPEFHPQHKRVRGNLAGHLHLTGSRFGDTDEIDYQSKCEAFNRIGKETERRIESEQVLQWQSLEVSGSILDACQLPIYHVNFSQADECFGGIRISNCYLKRLNGRSVGQQRF